MSESIETIESSSTILYQQVSSSCLHMLSLSLSPSCTHTLSLSLVLLYTSTHTQFSMNDCPPVVLNLCQKSPIFSFKRALYSSYKEPYILYQESRTFSIKRTRGGQLPSMFLCIYICTHKCVYIVYLLTYTLISMYIYSRIYVYICS